ALLRLRPALHLTLGVARRATRGLLRAALGLLDGALQPLLGRCHCPRLLLVVAGPVHRTTRAVGCLVRSRSVGESATKSIKARAGASIARSRSSRRARRGSPATTRRDATLTGRRTANDRHASCSSCYVARDAPGPL